MHTMGFLIWLPVVFAVKAFFLQWQGEGAVEGKREKILCLYASFASDQKRALTTKLEKHKIIITVVVVISII